MLSVDPDAPGHRFDESGGTQPRGKLLGLTAPQLRAVGATLLLIGIVLLAIGLGIAIFPAPPMPDCPFGTPIDVCRDRGDAWFAESSSRNARIGGLSGVGLALIGGGLGIIGLGSVRATARYYAAEAAPAVRIAADAVAQGLRQARPSTAPQSPVVRVKCRSCGYLETEDAQFCSKCAQPL